MISEKNELDKRLVEANEEISFARKNLLDAYKNAGILDQKHEELESQKNYFLQLQDEFTIADLFMKCMQPNGISYDIFGIILNIQQHRLM